MSKRKISLCENVTYRGHTRVFLKRMYFLCMCVGFFSLPFFPPASAFWG